MSYESYLAAVRETRTTLLGATRKERRKYAKAVIWASGAYGETERLLKAYLLASDEEWDRRRAAFKSALALQQRTNRCGPDADSVA